MSFREEFGRGMQAYGEAHRVLVKHKLSKFLWLPGLVTVAFTLLYFAIAVHFANRIPGEAEGYPGWLSWMGGFTYWLMISLYWVAALFLFMWSLKYILQVLLAPILSNLSVAVEQKIWGREPDPITWGEFFQDMGRSLLLSIRNVVIEIFLCVLMGFVPGVGQIGGFVVSSYFSGFGYMDYVLERKRMTISDAVKFVRVHKGLAIGLGTVNNLCMLIPFFGWVITPTYATIAATMETLRILHPEDRERLDQFGNA